MRPESLCIYLVFRIYLPPFVPALILSFTGEVAKRLGAAASLPAGWSGAGVEQLRISGT